MTKMKGTRVGFRCFVLGKAAIITNIPVNRGTISPNMRIPMPRTTEATTPIEYLILLFAIKVEENCTTTIVHMENMSMNVNVDIEDTISDKSCEISIT